MTQIYKYLLSDSSKNSTFILKKNLANNSIFALVLDSILDSRSSNSISIFQFCDSALTWLRLQSFDIRLDDEPWVGTPLCRYLMLIGKSREVDLKKKSKVNGLILMHQMTNYLISMQHVANFHPLVWTISGEPLSLFWFVRKLVG